MMHYVIQVVLFQVLFLAVYDLFLSEETFFTKNRFYLLGTAVISFVLPFLKIPSFQKVISSEIVIQLPEFFLSPEKVMQKSNWYQSLNYFNILFWIGVVFLTLFFLMKLYKILCLIKMHQIEKKSNYKLVFIPNKSNAFSFFKYIFLGEKIPKEEQKKVIMHELVHCTQHHSFDLLFFELLKIFMWFNPMIYSYQKRISLIHEYISDAIATKSVQKENYINSLLSNVFQVENISFVNQFYKPTILKKRIMMLTKKQSNKTSQLKYFLLIPVLLSMLFYISCSENEEKEKIEAAKEPTTIYTQMGKNKIIETKGDKESYLDFYIGTKIPDWKEISYNELSLEEKKEYDNKILDFQDIKKPVLEDAIYRLFKVENGRTVIGHIIDFSKTPFPKSSEMGELEAMSFMNMDTAPTFPGCETGDRNCFSKGIQKHFAKNINLDLPNQLGLESGVKRIFINFKIAKDGSVMDVKVRAPHKKLNEEVLKVMQSLPKMTPGTHQNKLVAVTYSIPFKIVVQ